nr:hypothetical protein [Desulforamulus aquiferis]
MRGRFKSLFKSSLREGWPMYILALVTMLAGVFLAIGERARWI